MAGSCARRTPTRSSLRGPSPTGQKDYWAESHASANRDLTRIPLASNWGEAGREGVDTYRILLPPDCAERLE